MPDRPPTLTDALEALRERKRAAGLVDFDALPEGTIRLLWSGLELDLDEVRVAVVALATHLAESGDEGLELGTVVSASFTEGLGAGILLERMRAAHDARQFAAGRDR